jgi:hypothetical protein
MSEMDIDIEQSMKSRARVIAFMLLFAVNVSGWAAPQPASLEFRQVTDNFEFRSGVIVDSRELTVYLMNPNGGIDAVDLSSGKHIWSTSNSAKPLLLNDRRLVTQAASGAPTNFLRIVVLDADNGRELLATTVELPRDVQAAIDDGL